MSADILGTSWDQCRSMVQYSFTSTETKRLVRTDSPGRPPRLSHSSWTMHKWRSSVTWIILFAIWFQSGCLVVWWSVLTWFVLFAIWFQCGCLVVWWRVLTWIVLFAIWFQFGCLVVWRSALTWIVLSAFDSFQLVSYGVMKIYYDYSTIVCRFHSDELHHVRFFPLISEIAYLSEMADSCDEILNNGLYVNLTYRLHNQTTDADSFQNCCKFSSASFVTFYGLYVRRIHT